jgi:CBS domain-containing protein
VSERPVSDRVRDAMVPAPVALDGSDSAQEAGLRLVPPEVRAVLVCDGGRLTGVVTRKTLVREVVATGKDPASTRLADIAEAPVHVLQADTLLEDAFRDLEQRDLERVPVVEDGMLVGVLSRSGVRRRLAEDEPPREADGSN